jgi:putative membrane protein
VPRRPVVKAGCRGYVPRVSHSARVEETATVRRIIFALSVGVIAAVLVVMVLAPRGAAATQPSGLAQLNVTLNASAGLFLLAGFACVRTGHVTWHRRCMLTAFGLSTAFLVSYVLHHASVGSVPFRGEGFLRPIYFGILVPHIVLAGVIVPLALFTLYRGWVGKITAHRRIARVTLPLWLFVSASGVIVYFMLYYLP